MPLVGPERPSPDGVVATQTLAHLQMLTELARAMAAESRDRDAVVERAVRGLAACVGDVAAAFLVTSEQTELVATCAFTERPELQAALAGPETVPRFPVLERAIATGEALLVVSAEADGPAAAGAGDAAALARWPVSSIVAAPILVGGSVMGALELVRYAPAAPHDEADRRFVGEIADRLALVLENARLFEEQSAARRRAEKAAARAALLQSVTAALSRAASASDVARVALAQALPALDASAGVFAALGAAIDATGEARASLAMIDAVGLPHELRRALRTVSIDGRHPLAEAVRGRAAMYFETGEALGRLFPEMPAAGLGPGGAVALLPLLTGRDVLGAFALRWPAEHPFDADERTFLDLLARHCAQALERARLYEQERGARAAAEGAVERLRRLQGLTAALAEATIEAEVGVVAVERCMPAVGATAARLHVFAGDDLTLVAAKQDSGHGGLGSDDATVSAWWGRPSALARAARAHGGVYLHTREEVQSWHGLGETAWDAWQAPSKAPRRAATAEVHRLDDAKEPLPGAQALVPLVFKGQPLGLLSFDFREPRRFGATDRSFLEAVARQCAQALERARLLDTERRARERASFLADASSLFAASRHDVAVLRDLARLAVPAAGEFCAVETVDEGGALRLVELAHAEPERAASLRAARTTGEGLLPALAQAVLRAANPVLMAELRPDHRLAGAESERLAAIGARSLMAVPLVARGKPLGVLTLAATTAARRYGEDDVRLVQELAHRASLAVENARLYRELEAAVQVRDDFLAVAGHELRNPLTALLMHAQSLERIAARDPADARVGERLGKIGVAGRRLERLINELLDVSRITGGRLRLEPEPTDLGQLVAEIIGRFADAASAAGCDLRLEAEPDVRGTWDPGRLDQVVSNLLSNALKYGRGRPVNVTVRRSKPTTASGTGAVAEWAVLSVSDGGIGIPVPEQQRIFERFERAVSHREFGGFGLGLWIARQIVEASRGVIEVESAPGAGATFTVRLPVRAGE